MCKLHGLDFKGGCRVLLGRLGICGAAKPEVVVEPGRLRAWRGILLGAMPARAMGTPGLGRKYPKNGGKGAEFHWVEWGTVSKSVAEWRFPAAESENSTEKFENSTEDFSNSAADS